MMQSLREYGLVGNPFPVVPDPRVREWAGRPEVKRLITDVARSVLIDDTGLSEFVVVHGDWGAGKTHALKYLVTMINEAWQGEFQSLALYMAKIKVGPKLSFLELYRRIMQEVGLERIRWIAGELARKIDAEAERRSSQMASSEVKRLYESRGGLEQLVVEALPEEDRRMVRLLLELSRGDEGALEFLIGGKAPGKKSDYQQPITADFDAVHVLGDFFRAVTGPIGEAGPVYKGVHLLIDEAEDALQAKANDQAELWGSIRELINSVPYRMALLIAFTAEAAFLEAVMPEAVLERTTRRNIELQALEVEEAKLFLSEHLASHRPESFSSPNPYFPFEEAAVELVLEREPVLVPRKIFRNMRMILERAVRREGLEPGQPIDAFLAGTIIQKLGI